MFTYYKTYKELGKKINNNGFEYLDLGLPSGTLWATMNVGASKPTDGGLYFQWGDTIGYAANQVGTGSGKKKFYWTDYKFSIEGSSSNFSKYNETDNKTVLELEDDAAHVNMGGDWHMPTPEQIQELIDNTDTGWTTSDDRVNGILFISKTDPSKSIFIPAAGVAWDGLHDGSGSGGSVWSSMLLADDVRGGQRLGFYSGGVNLNNNNRNNGFSVRGVLG